MPAAKGGTDVIEAGLSDAQVRARNAARKYRESQERDMAKKRRSGSVWMVVALFNASVCLALCTVKAWRYFELSVAQDLLPREVMVAIDERVPPSLFLFNFVTTAQAAYQTVKEPTVQSISGCASGNTIAAIFTIVLYLECDLETSVWLARHMAGEHMCPREGEGRLFVAFAVWMMFGSYHAHQFKHFLGDGEVKVKLQRVIQECRQEAEEAEARGEEPSRGFSSVLPERGQNLHQRSKAGGSAEGVNTKAAAD